MSGDEKAEIAPTDKFPCPKCCKDMEVYHWTGGLIYIECRPCRKRALFKIEDNKLYEIKRDRRGRVYKNAI